MRAPLLLLLPAIALGVSSAPTCHAQPRAAPAFVVRGLDGRSIRLTDFKGKPVVIDFWATWCAPCRASMPHLDTLQRRYQSRGLVVIGLSVDEGDTPAVRQFAERVGVAFRLAMASESVLDRYGPIRFLPTTFFVNRKGAIVRTVRGYIDPEMMDAYVEELF